VAQGYGLGTPSSSQAAASPAQQKVQAQMQPATPPAPQPPDVVRGQEMREVSKETRIEQLIWTYAWLIALVVIGGISYQAWSTRRELRTRN